MRDNVNTNYGARVEAGNVLNQTNAAGGKLMPTLAGYTLNPLLPKGGMRWEAAAEVPAAFMVNPALAAASACGTFATLGERLSGLPYEASAPSIVGATVGCRVAGRKYEQQPS